MVYRSLISNRAVRAVGTVAIVLLSTVHFRLLLNVSTPLPRDNDYAWKPPPVAATAKNPAKTKNDTKREASSFLSVRRQQQQQEDEVVEIPPHAEQAERPEPENKTARKESTKKFDAPELFMDRLNRLLPPTCQSLPPGVTISTCVDAEHDRRLFVEDVARIESELLRFNIPRTVVLDFEPAYAYVSLVFWRWLNLIDGAKPDHLRLCPNCIVRHNSTANAGMNATRTSLFQTDPGDAKIDHGCPAQLKPEFQAYDEQITVGGCGESQSGSGSQYFLYGRKAFDYDAGFVDTGGLFHRTYAHLHLSPPAPEYNLTELFNVTDMVRELLRPPQAFVREGDSRGEEAMFTHNNCMGIRGQLVASIVASKELGIAGYSECFHTQDGHAYEPKQFYFQDCEGTRDSVKTLLSSLHKFTFSLENTLSRDYVTEKRYQALLARSVPIVWNNHNSLDYLPDPDAAVLVDPQITDPVELAKDLRQIAANTSEYAKFFAWKKRGLRADFVRRLFLSSDFQACRLCEYIAHHHPPPPHRRQPSAAAEGGEGGRK